MELKAIVLQLKDFVSGVFWLLAHERAWQVGAGLLGLWALHAWAFFKSDFSAKQWALKPERHKAWHALAYLGALPVRLLFSAFAGGVALLIWALLAGFVYYVWSVVHG
jgi:hypothetical protein